MSKQRAKGTKWETASRKILNAIWPNAKRTGSRAYELGDLENTGEWTWEAKHWARWGWKDVAKWMDQVTASQRRTGTKYKGLLVKRNYSNDRRAYVMMELDDFVELCREYGIK